MKIINLFVMLFLMVGTIGFVVAEEDMDIVSEPKKIGFFSNQMYKLNFAFTFNKEKKIDLALEMAEKRLAEAELLAEEDPEAYERAQERYDDLVARAEEILADMEADDDENASAEQLGRIVRIQNKFERHRDHANEIYTRAIERFEINNASVEKLERFDMFHERALNRSYEMEERILEKQENAIRKYKTLSEMTDEELEDLVEKIEDDEGLTMAREVREERFEKRLERFEQLSEGKFEAARERLENSSLNEEQKEQIGNMLEIRENRFEEAGEIAVARFENQMETVEVKIGDAIKKELESQGTGGLDEFENNETY